MDDVRFVRSYGSKTLVGNWFEDIALLDEKTKDFLDRKEKGQLLFQKLSGVLGNSDSTISTSPKVSGPLKFGDKVQILNAGADCCAIRMNKAVPRRPAVLNISVDHTVVNMKPDDERLNVMSVTASENCKPLSRNIFEIVSVDGSANGADVCYGQPFQICSANSERYYLSSDTIPMSETKTSHRNNQVAMCKDDHFKSHWQAEYYHPKLRDVNDEEPIEVGKIVVLRHVKTGQALCLEKDNRTMTLFGNEYEVSSKTKLTDHKAESDVNYWVFTCANTVSSLEEIKRAEAGDTQTPQNDDAE